MAQQIRSNVVMNHRLDHDLRPSSGVRDLGVSKRSEGSSDLQEAGQWLNATIFEGGRDLVMGRYSVRVHPGYVGCGVCEARVEGD